MIHAINLDERTKKVLLVLCILFIVVLLIVGILYNIIKSYMEKQGKKMDNYMYDLIKTGIVKKPREFKRAVRYHERRSFYNNLKWPFRISIILTALALLTTMWFFNSEYQVFFKEAFKLIPIFKWPTVGETNEALKEIEGATLLKGPDWMPVSVFPTIISKNPDFKSPMLYISTIYYILMIACVFGFIKATLGYIARYNKGMKKAKEVFIKDLDKLDIGTIMDYSNAKNSNIPNQEDYEVKDRS